MNLNFSIKPILYFASIFFVSIASSQNLLDTPTWTIGSGATNGYSKIGDNLENIRELGSNHIGEEFVLWQCVPENIVNQQCGGFQSSYKTINPNNTYRLSVWMKKTNSNNGTSFFGTRSFSGGTYNISTLAGNTAASPYFFVGDLPKLERWYLLVAFVHNSSYASAVNEGRIYDGVTGEEVQTITDFKFTNTATNIFHRAFLYNDADVHDRQYMYSPRIEQVNNEMPSVNELLRLNQDSRLFLTYDTAGNQTRRLYCPDSPNGNACTPPASSKQSKESIKEDIADSEEDIKEETKNYSKEVSIIPNPTKGLATINITSKLISKIEFIKLYNINSALIQNVKFKDSKGNIKIDLSGKPTGLYFVHIHFEDGSESVTKKIIKE